MIAPFVRELEQVFGWLLAASWQASVLALFVLVIQRMLGSRLNPRWRYALWLLVLLRLVLPVQPESALSLFQFAPPPPAQLVTTVTEPWQPLFTGKPYPSPSDPEPMVKPNYPFSYFTLLAFLWLGGAMILLVLTWEANRRFARQVANSPEISDPELLKLFAEARAELGVRRAIRLIENNQLQSPAIMGLFQPTLLLPADVRGKFDERELRFIFLHELAHLKRGDVMVQALIALLQILHWFNPALWYAFRRMRIDREPATDALVLSRTGEAEKERYGLMLIKLLEHFNQRHSLPTLVGILEDKDQFKRRFSLIARFTRGAYGWSVLGVLLIGILGIACLTKSKANENSALTADYLITNLERFADGVHSIDYSETRGDPKGSHSFEHWQEMGELQRIERFTPNLDTHGKPSGTFHVIISYDGDYGYMYSPDSDRLVRQKEPFLDLTEGYSSGLEGGPLMPFEFLDKKGVRSSSGRVTLQTLKSPDALAARATLEPDKNRSWEGHPCIAVKISGGNDRWDSQAPVDFVAYFAKDLDFYPVAYEVYKHGKLSRRYWVVKFASIPLVSGKVFRYPELAGGFCYDSDTLHSSSGGGYSFESMAPSDLKINTLSKADFTIQPPPGGYIEDRDDGDKLIKVPPAQAPPQAPAQSDPPTNTTDTKAANANTQTPAAVQTTAATTTVAPEKNPAEMARVALKVVQIDEDDYQTHRADIDAAVQKGDAASLSDLKSFHLLFDNPIVTKAGEQGVLEAVRVFPYPIAFAKDASGKITPTDFTKRNLGVRFVLLPTITGNQINLKGDLFITRLEGWIQTKENPHEPYFNVREAPVSESFASGQTKGFQMPGGAQMESSDPAVVSDPDNPLAASKNPKALRRIFFFLTASGFSADGKAIPSPGSAQLDDPKLSQFVERVNTALHAPDNKEYKDLFFVKDIPETDQVALNARFESLMMSLVGNSAWKINVIPAKEIPPETNTDLNLEAVCGLEIQNAEKDGSHRVVLPVGCSFGEYFIAESRTPGPGALMLEAVQKGDTAALQKLFDQGVDPNVDQCNPVYWAIYYHQPEILKLLLAHDAETDRWSPPGDVSPIELARKKYPDLVPILQEGMERNRPKHIAKLTAKMQSIRIDHLAFKDTPLNEAIGALQAKSKQADSDGQGVNFVLRVAPSAPGTPANPASQPGPTITLTLADVSLDDALRVITQAAMFQYSVEEYAIYLRPADDGQKLLTVRTFLIPYGFFKAKSSDTLDVKQELIGHGIEFSPDATATFLPMQNKLVVRNTPEQLDKIATLIETFPDPTAIPKTDAQTNTNTNDPNSQFLQAAQDGNVATMQKILDQGVDPNKPGVWAMVNGKPDLMTPLAAAVNSGSVQAVALLLDHGAKTEGDKAKLMVIAVEAHPAIAKLLWSRGNRDVSPLSYAISQGASAADIAKLLDQGSPADSSQDDTITPLGFVAQKGNLDLVKLLVARGADIDRGGFHSADFSDAPVALAAFNGQDEVVDYLLAHGAKPESAALYEAAHNSTPYNNTERSHEHFEKTVRLLLDAGALKNATPEEQGYIVYAPIWTRQGPPNATVLKMILDAGGNPNAPMPFTAENGEKPNTVIGYYRDYCARHKEDPNFGTGWEKIKALLDMLEAAAKGAAPNAYAVPAASPDGPKAAQAAPFEDVAISGKVRFANPEFVDLGKSVGYLTSVDGDSYEFHFQPDGSFVLPHVKPEVYNRHIRFVRIEQNASSFPPESDDMPLSYMIVDGTSQNMTMNLTLDAPFKNVPKGSIQVEFKVVEIQDDVYLAHQAEIDAGVEKGGAEILDLLNNLKGVSVFSAPSVTTKPGLKANIDVVREFPYAIGFEFAHPGKTTYSDGSTAAIITIPTTPREFVTADVGVKAEITPSLEQGKIILNGKFSVIDFEGFTKSNAGANMPSFETRETHFYEALDDNQLMGIWIPGAHFDEQTVTDHDSLGKIISEKKEAVKKRLLIFLQARLVK